MLAVEAEEEPPEGTSPADTREPGDDKLVLFLSHNKFVGICYNIYRRQTTQVPSYLGSRGLGRVPGQPGCL